MANEFTDIPPKVSVIMITYGHEKYIKEAINGIFLQKTDFLIELIIANDRSPDESDKIIRKTIENCPSNITIKYIFNKNNLGANANYINAYSHSKGNYIASCEGDDYWIDPLKLQKQIDFLEENPDYSIVFHRVKELNSSATQNETILKGSDEEKTYTLDDLANGNFIHTPSVMFKKNFEKLPVWMEYSPIGDYPLHMLNAEYGLIKYLPDEMAVYRVGEGMWSSKSRVYQIVNTTLALNFLMSHFSNNEKIKGILKNQYNFLMNKLSEHQEIGSNSFLQKIAYTLPYKKICSLLVIKMKYSLKR